MRIVGCVGEMWQGLRALKTRVKRSRPPGWTQSFSSFGLCFRQAPWWLEGAKCDQRKGCSGPAERKLGKCCNESKDVFLGSCTMGCVTLGKALLPLRGRELDFSSVSHDPGHPGQVGVDSGSSKKLYEAYLIYLR